jgi:nucleoside-diphosphate-sugar epimerase
MLKIVVTGANGFVGSALCIEAIVRGMAVRGITRTPCDLPAGVRNLVVDRIDDSTNWRQVLAGCDAVIHLAARVHVMHDTAADPLTAFRVVNLGGTLSLARQAAAAGVKRFVFISSVKVNGEATFSRKRFTAEDVPAPLDAYGVSKVEAEEGLRELFAQTGMEVVIIRPPLVYGPGVKANFAGMMRWLRRGIPLPLGAIHNQRSLVALDNLIDLIVTCLTHPAAANQTFLVCDGEDLSTTQLLRRMGAALGTPARLLPVPMSALKLGAALLRRPELVQRLCGSLQIDMSKTQELLGWRPPFSVEESLQKTAEGYLREAGV